MHAHSNVVSVGMCRYCGLRISRPAGSPTFYCLGCGREFATHTEHNAHVAQVITSLPDIAIVALPERVVNERGRDVVEGAGIQFAFTGDEFQLWVWNSVSGHTLQKRYDRSVGIDLPGLVLAAANAAEEVR